jgi:uncharacterized protein (TIGR03437 family)
MVRVLNGGAGNIGWSAIPRTISGGAGWLNVTPAQGTSSAAAASPFVVTVDPSGLAAGSYYGQIQIVSPGATNSPRFVTGAAPAPQVLTVAKLHGQALQFTSAIVPGNGGAWLTSQTSSGAVAPNRPATITLQPNVAGLQPIVYTASLNLTFSDGSTRSVPVSLALASAPLVATASLRRRAAGCTPSKLIPAMTAFGPGFTLPAGWPAPLEAKVVDDCGQNLTSGSVIATFSNGDPPLPLRSSQDGTWSATWIPKSVASLTVTLNAQISPPAISGSVQVSGQLNLNNAVPIVSTGGILNAASFGAQEPAAPGALMAIFGSGLAAGTSSASSLPLPVQLGGTQVVIGGIPMPLLFVSPAQINAMAPFDLTAGSAQQVIVQNAAALSVPEDAAVAPAAPGAFTYDGSGSGGALVIVLNNDGSSNLVTPSAPAHPGSIIVIYCTGLGGVQGTVQAGDAAPLSPLAPANESVTVTVGGAQAQVLFAGLVPTFTGFYQINAVIPAGSTTGDNVPLTISAAGVTGPMVTLAIH